MVRIHFTDHLLEQDALNQRMKQYNGVCFKKKNVSIPIFLYLRGSISYDIVSELWILSLLNAGQKQRLEGKTLHLKTF